MQISKARDNEIRKCLQSLINEPFGIQLTEKPPYQVYYDRGVGMVLLNLDLINKGDSKILLERKMFLGIFADKVEETGWYAVAYLILTSPSEHPKKVNILITRPDGILVFGGIADVEANNTKFSIRTISQIDVLPVLLEGILVNNELELTTTQFSTTIQAKNQAKLHTPQ